MKTMNAQEKINAMSATEKAAYDMGHDDGYGKGFDDARGYTESMREIDKVRQERFKAFKANIAKMRDNQPEYMI